MHDEMRKVVADLRTKSSAEVADWLLERYPTGGEAIVILEHISLRRSDYRRLGEQYFAGPAHAHNRAYKLFAQRLGLGGLVTILAGAERRNARDADLLAYHLRPLLGDARTDDELREATAFVDALSSS